MTPLPALDARAHFRDAEHAARRRFAADYTRNRHDLRYWMFKRPESREAIFQAHYRPNDPGTTKRLCRALYADWRTALALPQYLRKGGIRAQELRRLFTAECEAYRRQRARLAALAAE